MKLFNEIKNRYFSIITEAVRRINASPNGSIAISEFERIFTDGFSEDGNAFKIAREILSESMIFTVEDKPEKRDTTAVKLAEKSDVPIIPTAAEQIWLLSLLKLPEAKLFLRDDIRKKLVDILSEYSNPIDPSFFAESDLHLYADAINAEMSEKLQLIMSAIHTGHKLRYSNVTANGDVVKDCVTSPIKIEYSIKSKVFRLSHFPDSDKRPVKSNLSRMFNLNILEDKIDTCSLSKMMEARLEDEPLVFIVYNTHHRAIERAKIIFSEYPREITDNIGDDGELNSAEFVLHYYSFQEAELLREILSFGPRIKVISPKYIVEQIVKKLNLP